MFVDPMKEFFNFLRLVVSDDKGVPSSSRIIGALIFTVLTVAIGATTFVLLWRIFYVNDQANLKVLVDGLSKFQWQFLYLSATALALYGINVWKYIAQLRTGVAFTNEDGSGPSSGVPIGGVPYSPYGGIGIGGVPYRPYTPPQVPNVDTTGASGKKIPINPGTPVEPHSDPVPQKVKTSIAGIGSDE